MKKVLLVGDSYTFGVGCSDTPTGDVATPSEFSWGSLLGRLPGFSVENKGVAGLDNLSIVECLWNQIQSHDHVDIIMFNASFITRFQASHPDTPFATVPVNPDWSYKNLSDPFNDAVNKYYRHLYDTRIGTNYTVSTILAGYACASLISAKFYWSIPSWGIPSGTNLATTPTNILERINRTRFISMADFTYSKNELAACKHPNDAGHLRYFNSVIKPLLIE